MITVKDDFEKRCLEINAYFCLLERVLEQEAQLYLLKNQTRKLHSFDAEVQKVLKSNVILMLYNLMESSIKSALVEVYEQISTKKIKYPLATEKVKAIWISTNHKKFKEKSDIEVVELLNTIDDVILKFGSDTPNISGNIDARKIRELAESIGFSSSVHYSTEDGAILFQIKSERNKLAHGEKSFTECGRSYTITDLRKMKNQTITYLRRILSNIEKFLQDEEYLQ